MPIFECPTCHKKVTYRCRDEVPYRPFCSQRCKLVDLGKWLNEEYRISEEMPEHLRPEPNAPKMPPDEEA